MKTRVPVVAAVGFIVTLVLAAAPLAPASPAAGTDVAKAPASQETTAQVPELTEYHEVIYKLWHEAWPAKDVAALSSLLPDIEAGAARIQKADLPGILRDKKAEWDAGVQKLSETVAQYRAAVSKKELQPLLDAGESLHRQFEVLIRTIRPALKELDAFHQTLYQLYHYDLPAYALPKIRAAVKDLQEKMAALNKAVLPQRMAPKQPAFEDKRRALDKAVTDLAVLAEAGTDEKAIRASIETMHAKYQDLESVF